MAVLTHIRRPEAIQAASKFVAGMTEHGIISTLPPFDIQQMGEALAGSRVEPLDTEHPIAQCEVAVVFGGDGTILRAAEWALVRDIPLLGVNLGHVGFLAEAESSEIDQVVEGVISSSYTVEERLTAQVRVRTASARNGGKVVWRSFAVNEVSVEKAARERMLEVLIGIDGRPLSRWGCDGVLVSTPTGSTAYAFSAGGPVLWPGLEALLLVPLSAHALFARPLVLGSQSLVQVQLVEAADAQGVVWCDGRRSIALTSGMEVEVGTWQHRLRLARLNQAPFTDRLVRKFGLSVEGWRGLAERRGPR